MKSVVCTLLLFVVTIVLGQQPVPSTPPFNPNPQSRGNNAPPNEQSPAEQMPPDTKAPAHVSNSDIERQLQSAFDQEPVLTGTHLKATADDDAAFARECGYQTQAEQAQKSGLFAKKPQAFQGAQGAD